ncbi:MAG TPA: hypothetical protein VJQ25_14000 [Nitrospira sp.]|nr:hypothetical protein [Nitrospira sp.]
MTMTVGETPLWTYPYSIYGMRMQYVTGSPALAAPVNELLKHFRRDTIEESAELTVCFRDVQDRTEIPLRLSSSARRLSAGTGGAVGDRRETGLPYEVIQDERRWIADFGDVGILVMDGPHGRADGYLINPETLHPNLIEYLFHLASTELFRHRGLYTIHAAALEKDGRGILISGNSGRGKTTSSLSLLRSGYRYLSDDQPLIQDAGAHVDVLPFPTKINVTQATIEFFPELADVPDHVPHPGSHKRSFHAEDLYPTSIGERCRPAMVLFPHVADVPHSHLELLSKRRALELLLPQALLVFDPEVAGREFQVLAKLARQVDCYRLHFGHDIFDLPNLLTPLLEQG